MKRSLFWLILAIWLLFPSVSVASTLTLTWQDTSNNEDGFRCERSTSGGSFAQVADVGVNVQTWQDISVIGGTNYCYRCLAYNTVGVSGYTNTACATAAATTTAGVAQIACVYTPTPPLPTGLIAAYGFNAGSGTVAQDTSGNGNTGTIVGAAWGAGYNGSALNFTLTSSVQVASITLNNWTAFTYCAWVNPRSQGAQNDGRLFHKGTNTARKQLQTDGGVSKSIGLYVDRASGAGQAVSTANALTLNQWQFVCGTYSEANGPRVYRNGVEVTYSLRTVGAGATTSDAGNKLYIGNRSTNDKGWDGWIDEVRIYNRALTPSELLNIMNVPIS